MRLQSHLWNPWHFTCSDDNWGRVCLFFYVPERFWNFWGIHLSVKLSSGNPPGGEHVSWHFPAASHVFLQSGLSVWCQCAVRLLPPPLKAPWCLIHNPSAVVVQTLDSHTHTQAHAFLTFSFAAGSPAPTSTAGSHSIFLVFLTLLFLLCWYRFLFQLPTGSTCMKLRNAKTLWSKTNHSSLKEKHLHVFVMIKKFEKFLHDVPEQDQFIIHVN